jgi:hypothetical protein
MGRAGRRWVEERFDWPVLAAKARRLLLPRAREGAPEAGA